MALKLYKFGTTNGTDGTELSQATEQEPTYAPIGEIVSLNTVQESATEQIHARADSGETWLNVQVTPVLLNADHWALAEDVAGVAGAYTYEGTVTLGTVTDVNKPLWRKAKYAPGEAQGKHPETDLWIRGMRQPTPPAPTGGVLLVAGGKWDSDPGGNALGGHYHSDDTHAYDSAANSWTKIAVSMPAPGLDMAFGVCDGKLYCLGGDCAQLPPGDPDDGRIGADLRAYDPNTQTWEDLPDIPLADASDFGRWDNPAAGGINGKFVTAYGAINLQQGENSLTQRCYAYDPVARTWARKADGPFARAGLMSAVVGGSLYILGDRFGTRQVTLERYTLASDTWETLSDCPQGRGYGALCAIGTVLVVCGGILQTDAFGNDRTFLKTTYLYDTATDSWTQGADAPASRNNWAAVSFDTRYGYFLGGEVYTQLWRYDLVLDLWETLSDIPLPSTKKGHFAMGALAL